MWFTRRIKIDFFSLSFCTIFNSHWINILYTRSKTLTLAEETAEKHLKIKVKKGLSEQDYSFSRNNVNDKNLQRQCQHLKTCTDTNKITSLREGAQHKVPPPNQEVICNWQLLGKENPVFFNGGWLHITIMFQGWLYAQE